MKGIPGGLVERSCNIPDTDTKGHTPLRQWRLSRKMSHKQAASFIGVSVATYYRYEGGFSLNMRKANEIVAMTRGKVRYRDLIADFKPEYA